MKFLGSDTRQSVVVGKEFSSVSESTDSHSFWKDTSHYSVYKPTIDDVESIIKYVSSRWIPSHHDSPLEIICMTGTK